MKDKHIKARIAMCLELAKLSSCPRRKFGALLLDPARNQVIGEGYNGGPRGGGQLCGGKFCLRDGVSPKDVELERDPDLPEVFNLYHWMPDGEKVKVWTNGVVNIDADAAEDIRRAYYEARPPIKSGTRIEIGCHHSEMNVICNAAAAGIATAGTWLIVTGEPCLMCSKLIHHAGIIKVIVVDGGYMGANGVQYLQDHGVEVEAHEGPKDPRA